MVGGAAISGVSVLLRRSDIPRLEDRLIVNDLVWSLGEDIRKQYGLKPRHWAVLQLVWYNTLRQKHTTAAAAAAHTGFSHQAAGMWLADLERMSYVARDSRGWCASKDAMLHPTQARDGRRAMIDRQIAVIHAASEALHALEKKRRRK